MTSITEVVNALADAVAAKVIDQLGKQSPSSTSAVQQRLYSVADTARYLGRTAASVQHLIKADAFPVVKHDKRTFVDVEDLKTFVVNHKSGV